MIAPSGNSSVTKHPCELLFRYDRPVPGMPTDEYRLPFPVTPVRNPLPPSEYPTPDLLMLTLNGPQETDLR